MKENTTVTLSTTATPDFMHLFVLGTWYFVLEIKQKQINNRQKRNFIKIKSENNISFSVIALILLICMPFSVVWYKLYFSSVSRCFPLCVVSITFIMSSIWPKEWP